MSIIVSILTGVGIGSLIMMVIRWYKRRQAEEAVFRKYERDYLSKHQTAMSEDMQAHIDELRSGRYMK